MAAAAAADCTPLQTVSGSTDRSHSRIAGSNTADSTAAAAAAEPPAGNNAGGAYIPAGGGWLMAYQKYSEKRLNASPLTLIDGDVRASSSEHVDF